MTTTTKEQATILAYIATLLSEDELLRIIIKSIGELAKIQATKDKQEEGVQRKFLKFIMSVYVTKYSYVDPFDFVAQTELTERLRNLVKPSEG